jgi:hypothetical protein
MYILYTKSAEVNNMPAIEEVEYERISYVKGMESYLKKLKNMPNSEAMQQSKINLQNSQIISEDGEFTEKYRYSQLSARS